MALQREPGSSIIAQYTVPVRGTWNSLAIHTIPTDALYDSMNVFLRKGKLRNRPGLTNLTTTQFDGPIIGATLVTTPTAKIVLACTQSHVYELAELSTEWVTSVSSASNVLAASNASTIDIALLETSGKYVALLAEQTRPLLQWDGLTHVVSDVVASSGTVPKAKSVCIAGRRVVYLIPPHTVGWTGVFDYTNFPPLALYRLAQTGDEGICVRAVSNLSFAVYKERSIYVARAQAGPDELAFNFAEPIRVDGPAGVHAVVDVNGAHVYMTRSGRIAMFDGSRYPQWVADGLWLFLQDDIDQNYAHLIHGSYDYRLHLVTFIYPKVGYAGSLCGMVMINMPYEGIDIQQGSPVHACFKGELEQNVTMACEMRFNRSINRSVFFVADQFDKSASIFDENADDDNGLTYECSMQLPMVAMPEAVQQMVTFETFVERKSHYGFMTVQPVSSDSLDTETGTLNELKEQIIDLETNPVVDIKPFNVPTRFLSLKYVWSSKNTVRYAGAVIYGRPIPGTQGTSRA